MGVARTFLPLVVVLMCVQAGYVYVYMKDRGAGLPQHGHSHIVEVREVVATTGAPAKRAEVEQKRDPRATTTESPPEQRPTEHPVKATNRLPMPALPANPDARTIFVSIAAFRDVECKDTLKDLFAKAKYPDRVRVGIACQKMSDAPEEECTFPEYLNSSAYHVTVRNVDAVGAKGPTYARYLASLMYNEEDYFFMIDSHCIFSKHWDVDIIEQHDVCDSPSGKCVLSVYPMALDAYGQPKQWIPHLCRNAGWTRQWPGPFLAMVRPEVEQPRPQPFVGGGLMFLAGYMMHEVPFDPHLEHVFFGEEITQAVRLWTHGYDLFSPSRNVLYHHYGRKGPANRGVTNDRDRVEQSYKRIRVILELATPEERAEFLKDPVVAQDIEKYGTGKVRTVADYWKFSRLDVAHKKHEAVEAYWCNEYGGRPPFSNQWKREAGYKGFD